MYGHEPAPRPDAGFILVLHDDVDARRLVSGWLAGAGHRPVESTGGLGLLEESLERYDAICLDLGVAHVHGFSVLEHLRAKEPQLPVIMVAPSAAEASGVARAGIYDVLVQPLCKDRLLLAVERAVERRRLSCRVAELEGELAGRPSLRGLVGDSPAMRELGHQLERVLKSELPVTIGGELGTGKELVARAIHLGSQRADGPFVVFNCAAIPDGLHEAELFGLERGDHDQPLGVRRGRFEEAHGGTLFLDQVEELSALTQASLLRALQDRAIRRVGARADTPADVRVISATHRDLIREVQAGRFREDLYFRLMAEPVAVPPLRERKEDIPRLVGHFLRKHRAEVGRVIDRVSPEALDALVAFDWPGNVRQLESVVHRAMLATGGGELELRHLAAEVRGQGAPRGAGARADEPGPPSQPPSVMPMRELERRAIKRALEASGGSVEKAAKLLGIGRATLYRRLAHYESVGQEL